MKTTLQKILVFLVAEKEKKIFFQEKKRYNSITRFYKFFLKPSFFCKNCKNKRQTFSLTLTIIKNNKSTAGKQEELGCFFLFLSFFLLQDGGEIKLLL